MPERTQRDELIDEAIGRLISEDTDSFAVVAVEDGVPQTTLFTENTDDVFLSIYGVLDEVLSMFEGTDRERLGAERLMQSSILIAEDYDLLEVEPSRYIVGDGGSPQ